MKINSKNKGSSGERELCKILNNRFGLGLFSRVPMSGAYTGGKNRTKTSNLSNSAKDTLSGDIITPDNFKFSIEHKFYKEASFWDLFNDNSNLKSWFIQCEGDAKFIEKEPMLIVKYNNKKRIVYIKNYNGNYIFSIGEWKCLWLENLLKEENSYFFT
jgi:hypothetical protein